MSWRVIKRIFQVEKDDFVAIFYINFIVFFYSRKCLVLLKLKTTNLYDFKTIHPFESCFKGTIELKFRALDNFKLNPSWSEAKRLFWIERGMNFHTMLPYTATVIVFFSLLALFCVTGLCIRTYPKFLNYIRPVDSRFVLFQRFRFTHSFQGLECPIMNRS